jgi:penicillin-binding protein 1C
MREITGVTGAAPAMHEIFTHLRAQRGTTWFTAQAGIQTHPVHSLTGHRVAAGTAGAVLEKCLHEPPPEQPHDYDSEGRVLLPAEYNAWLASPQNSLGSLVAAGGESPELRIVRPAAGAVYFLDPDLPAAQQNVTLVAHAGSEIDWSSETLALSREGAATRIRLQEGTHTLTARERSTGRTAQTWIEVRPL